MGNKTKLKIALVSYIIIVCIVPPAPNIYTFIMSMIGFMCSVSANGIILKYLWSRPPMQQTLAQPLCMVQVTIIISITCKETLIVLLGNCFPNFFQSLFHDYPLWLCGFFNNRINGVSLLYSLMVLGTSKLVLLIKPILYHTADHTNITRYALLTLAGILIVDTVVYLTFSNPYYCHTNTMLRVASLYNKSTNVSLLKQQYVGKIHEALDHSLFAPYSFRDFPQCICYCKVQKAKVSKADSGT